MIPSIMDFVFFNEPEILELQGAIASNDEKMQRPNSRD